MKIASEHVQPVSIGTLFKNMLGRGRSVFLLSLIGSFLIIALSSLILFFLYEYIESLGFSESQLAILSTINNMLFISLTSVNIFYLLMGEAELPFMQQVKQSLIKTFKITPILIVATLIFSVFIFLGLGLFVIPGLILFAYLGVYSQTIVFENQGIIASLLRSRDLVKGSFLKVFGILVSLYLITNIFPLVPALTAALFISETYIWVEIIVYCISYMIMMPFIASGYVLLYFDLRSRQEPFDYKAFMKQRDKVMTL